MQQKKIISLMLIGILLIGGSYLIKYLFLEFNLAIPCIFYEKTGWLCPGCGMTRALVAILQFDFWTAIRNNVLLVILIPYGILLLGKFCKKYIMGQKFYLSEEVPRGIGVFLLIIVIGFGILRNFDFFWFLAPLSVGI